MVTWKLMRQASPCLQVCLSRLRQIATIRPLTHTRPTQRVLSDWQDVQRCTLQLYPSCCWGTTVSSHLERVLINDLSVAALSLMEILLYSSLYENDFAVCSTCCCWLLLQMYLHVKVIFSVHKSAVCWILCNNVPSRVLCNSKTRGCRGCLSANEQHIAG